MTLILPNESHYFESTPRNQHDVIVGFSAQVSHFLHCENHTVLFEAFLLELWQTIFRVKWKEAAICSNQLKLNEICAEILSANKFPFRF
jgi:hypothetical protein